MLISDAAAVNFIDMGESYEGIFVAYKRTFYKVPINLQLESLSEPNNYESYISRLVCKLFSRTKAVSHILFSGNVIMRSPMLNKGTYFLLHFHWLVAGGYSVTDYAKQFYVAKKFKFVPGASPCKNNAVQSVLIYLDVWFKEHEMPLS